MLFFTRSQPALRFLTAPGFSGGYLYSTLPPAFFLSQPGLEAIRAVAGGSIYVAIPIFLRFHLYHPVLPKSIMRLERKRHLSGENTL